MGRWRARRVVSQHRLQTRHNMAVVTIEDLVAYCAGRIERKAS